MFFKTYLSSAGLLFCLNQLSQAAAVDPCTLYAYGTNIDGLPVFYMNSLAYIGYKIPSSLDGTNITFTMNDTSLYAEKNTTAGGSGSVTGGLKFYIDVSTDATSQSGFTTTEDDTTTVTTTGFRFFGSDVYWEASDGTLSANFWATATDIDNVWNLIWNEPNDVLDGSTQVVIRTEPPGTTST